MKPNETSLQKACVTWFKLQFPNEIIFSVPNGAFLSGPHIQRAIQWKKLEATGALKGMLDLVIARPNRINAGLFIEMKFGDNKPTEEQKEVMLKLLSKGYLCQVCWSLDEFMTTVNNYFQNV